jgi:hypothetical protein
VEAELKEQDGVEVETVRGGLGELSVSIDDRKVVNANRLWSPTLEDVLNKVRNALAEER